MKKKTTGSPGGSVVHKQAVVLHECIGSLMREFRLEPGLLAGSPYAELHANDVELFELLTQPEVWNVQAIAKALQAPITTISSALDRLEKRGLIRRVRIAADRRKVSVELTSRGEALALRLRDAHIENCRNMLLRINSDQREGFLRFIRQISRK
ncbi:MAG TPA: MarR family transcriptional regulator [Edaphobacter sp.]